MQLKPFQKEGFEKSFGSQYAFYCWASNNEIIWNSSEKHLEKTSLNASNISHGFSILPNIMPALINPAGTRRPGDVPWRSPKDPNVRDLQGTSRGLLGDQQKN